MKLLACISDVLKSLHDWVSKVLRKIRRTYRCTSRQYQRSRTDYSQIVVGIYSLYKPTAITHCMELFRNLKEICLLVQHVWSSFASVKHTTKSTAAEKVTNAFSQNGTEWRGNISLPTAHKQILLTLAEVYGMINNMRISMQLSNFAIQPYEINCWGSKFLIIW